MGFYFLKWKCDMNYNEWVILGVWLIKKEMGFEIL